MCSFYVCVCASVLLGVCTSVLLGVYVCVCASVLLGVYTVCVNKKLTLRPTLPSQRNKVINYVGRKLQ